MVATPQSAMDIVKSLVQDDIPVKLRCASCNNLVLDAYRLPCCDQNICQTCQSSLPEACPVCAHSPIAAADCKPNKSLRLTIRAFLKSEEKKREKEKAAGAISIPQTPVTPLAPTAPELGVAINSETKETSVQAESAVAGAARDDGHGEESKAVENNNSTEEGLNQSANNGDANEDQAVTEQEVQDGGNTGQHTALENHNTNGGMGIQSNQSGGQMPGQFGFGANQGAFPGMNWAQMNAFNPMMQMQMQNGMANGNWGFPNMMAMGMNPMDMSQGMFGGFGMQGMGGMNGMMGNGMDFNSGFGWNNGQHSGNAYAGGGGGYNQAHQSQFPQQSAQNNLQNQNRSHGQASFQRKSSVASQSHSNHGNDSVVQSIERSSSTQAKGTSVDAEKPIQDPRTRSVSKGIVGNSEHTSDHGSSKDNAEVQTDQKETSAQAPIAGDGEGMTDSIDQDQATHKAGDNLDQNAESADQYTNQYADSSHDVNGEQYMGGYNGDNNYVQGHMHMQDSMNHGMNYNNNYMNNQSYQMGGADGFGYSGRGRGRGRGGWRGRGGFHQHQFSDSQIVTPMQPIGQGVEGAPTGPKAMREGFPNRGGFRGRGVFHAPRGGYHSTEQSVQQAPSLPASIAPNAPLEDAKPVQEADGQKERSRSRSKSRSRSRSHSKSRRTKHRRSRSVSSDRDSYERERKHRRHRSSRTKKYEDEDDYRYEDERQDDGDVRSREPSVEDSKRHRSRREKEKHRSSRSHRDSSRERRKHSRRSRSPRKEEDNYDQEFASSKPASESGRRKSRPERHRERDDEKSSEKERSRHKDRDYDREKYREKDREDRKKSRRDRSASQDHEDGYRSSKHSRRDKEKDKTRDRRRHEESRDYEEEAPSKVVQPSKIDTSDQLEFKIQGRAKEHRPSAIVPVAFNPPTGPSSARAPPTGPRALVTQLSTMKPPSGPSSARRSQPPTPVSSEATPGPLTPAVDPHTLEREARNRERMVKEEQRRLQLRGGGATSLERKRSSTNDADGDAFAPPTGPRGDRERKKSRRVNYKYEDEENDEVRARRVEKEREDSRWH